MSSAPNRVSEFFVDPLFIDRWSPRAFNADPISDETLFSLLEAARWAPSANNSQPWRFIYARNGGNWAGQASALLLLLSKKVHARDGGQPAPLRNHSFDTGAAWASLAFQAHYLGWKTHAIGGFDREGSRQALAIPDHYNVEILVAIGKQAERDTLHPDFWEREKPNGRKPVRELAAEGEFAFSD
jgi:nitroreductase